MKSLNNKTIYYICHNIKPFSLVLFQWESQTNRLDVMPKTYCQPHEQAEFLIRQNDLLSLSIL